jgi:hypothetical protein
MVPFFAFAPGIRKMILHALDTRLDTPPSTKRRHPDSRKLTFNTSMTFAFLFFLAEMPLRVCIGGVFHWIWRWESFERVCTP